MTVGRWLAAAAFVLSRAWYIYVCALYTQALPADGYLLALDKDVRSMAVARKYWDLAGVGHKVWL